jgi:hypothetical protein
MMCLCTPHLSWWPNGKCVVDTKYKSIEVGLMNTPTRTGCLPTARHTGYLAAI